MNLIEFIVFCVGVCFISVCLGALAVKFGCKLGDFLYEKTK